MLTNSQSERLEHLISEIAELTRASSTNVAMIVVGKSDGDRTFIGGFCYSTKQSTDEVHFSAAIPLQALLGCCEIITTGLHGEEERDA